MPRIKGENAVIFVPSIFRFITKINVYNMYNNHGGRLIEAEMNYEFLDKDSLISAAFC